jgi:uncharacterized protein YegL
VLDRSGSIATCLSECIGGINAFIEGQKKEPGEARFTSVLFDTEFITYTDGMPIKDVVPFDKLSYVPRGMTALLDAVGHTIEMIGKRLDRTAEHEKPGKVLVAVLTDGLENCSKKFSYSQIREMIKHQREVYSWAFLFLGASLEGLQKIYETTDQMGIPQAGVANMAINQQGQQISPQAGMGNATRSLNAAVSAYRMGDPNYQQNLAGAGQYMSKGGLIIPKPEDDKENL